MRMTEKISLYRMCQRGELDRLSSPPQQDHSNYQHSPPRAPALGERAPALVSEEPKS